MARGVFILLTALLCEGALAKSETIPVRVIRPGSWSQEKYIPAKVVYDPDTGEGSLVIKSESKSYPLDAKMLEQVRNYYDASSSTYFEAQRHVGGVSPARLAPKSVRIFFRTWEIDGKPHLQAFASYRVPQFVSSRWSDFEELPRLVQIRNGAPTPFDLNRLKTEKAAASFYVGEVAAVVGDVNIRNDTVDFVPVYHLDHPKGRTIESFRVPIGAIIVGADDAYYDYLRTVDPKNIAIENRSGTNERHVLRSSRSFRTGGVLYGDPLPPTGGASREEVERICLKLYGSL